MSFSACSTCVGKQQQSVASRTKLGAGYPRRWKWRTRRAEGRRANWNALPASILPSLQVELPRLGRHRVRNLSPGPHSLCPATNSALTGQHRRSRRKRLLGVKSVDVYAVGFYVDQAAAEEALGPKYSGETAAALESTQALCDDVAASHDIEKTVRIVVTSGMVNHDRFLGGLRDSLVPACEKSGGADALPDFEQLFEGAKFRKGLEIALTSTKGGGLAARIDSRDVGEVKSAAFTKAFFGLYLGADPVSPDGKKDIATGLADLLSQKTAGV